MSGYPLQDAACTAAELPPQVDSQAEAPPAMAPGYDTTVPPPVGGAPGHNGSGVQHVPVPQTPIVTLRYNGPPPPPHPPVTEPTPDEEYAQAESQRQATIQQREAAAASQPAPNGGSTFSKIAGIAGKVAKTVEKTASNVHALSEAKVRQAVASSDRDRFKRNFPELSDETAVADYTCKVMNQGHSVQGNIVFTAKHVCFSSDTLREMIPLTEIASVQRSVGLETIDGSAPFIMPVPAPHVVPNTLQLFTTKGQVFQFIAFESIVGRAGALLSTTIKGRPIDRAYNWLDHMWRAATPVPLPGVQYADF